MNAFDEFLQNILNKSEPSFEEELLKNDETLKVVEKILKQAKNAQNHYLKTGECIDYDYVYNNLGNAEDQESKENLKPLLTSKIKRNASRAAKEKIKSYALPNISSSESQLNIKNEPVSETFIVEPTLSHQEDQIEMPAPKQLPPQRKKKKSQSIKPSINTDEVRITRSKVKLEKIEEVININNDNNKISLNNKRKKKTTLIQPSTNDRESDIILEEPSIEVLSVCDSDNDDKKGNDKLTNKNNKNKDEANETKETNYEDAVSLVESEINKQLDATYVTSKNEHDIKECSVILSKIDNNELISDDESDKEIIESVKQPPIINICEPSPVKQKIRVFENYAQAHRDIYLKDQNNRNNNLGKEKNKYLTPTSKFAPYSNSTSKISRFITPIRNTSNSNLQSTSKNTSKIIIQSEYKEKELRRKEKDDAIKKRDALLQAQIEEKRRKREEKQLKAQILREEKEKEKLKLIDIQRIKEEKHKQLLQEQEEKKQKHREEVEKKRLLAKKKAFEEKQKEEQKRLDEERKQQEIKMKALEQEKLEEMKKKEIDKKLKQQDAMLDKQNKLIYEMAKKQKKLPKYMVDEAPLLPTYDCYDSDDDKCENTNAYIPLWAQKDELKNMQLTMHVVGEEFKNTFFSIQAHTVDLQEIFEMIDPRKLKRSSSAHWKKPPRYTMMLPITEDFIEASEEED